MNDETNEAQDYLPVSMLNQLEYCERRFYLMYVMGEMDVNVHVLEGSLLHQPSHTPGRESEGGVVTHRKVQIWSDRLRILGFTDVVQEIQAEESMRGEKPQLVPIEYKKGRMGKWLNDHIQLCAQAMCLEERSGVKIEYGYIFYFGSRRREQVVFTPELRQRTVSAIQRAFELSASMTLPPPLEKFSKCRDCSLEPICMPREITALQKTPPSELSKVSFA